MTLRNLALVFMPTLLHPPADNVLDMSCHATLIEAVLALPAELWPASATPTAS